MNLEVDIRLARPGFTLAASFAAPAGVTAFFGPSGAGKSTLVEILAGLLRPDEGRVAVGGEVLADTARRLHVPAHRRGVAVVFQDGRLFPHLSVRANLRYGAFFGRRRGPGDFDAIVAMLGIEPLLERRPATLSGGERGRVGIGRALMARPRLLVLDEPLAALDRARADEILPYLERLRAEAGLPIVYVSHALAEIVRLADTLVLLDRGRVTASGPVADVLGRLDLAAPGGERGAVVEASVAEIDAGHGLARLDFPGGSFRVPADGLAAGQILRLHIRARDVAVATEAPEGLSILNAIPATVVEMAPSGAAVELKLAAGPTILLARITRLSAESLGLVPGCGVHALVKSIALDRGRMLPLE